jgi:tetratricopeptide (TPR) repeat protein
MHSLVADQYQYLPVVGLIAVVCAGGSTWLHGGTWKIVRNTLAASAVLLLGWGTIERATVLASEDSLWADTVRKNPDSWVAQYNLGAHLVLKAHDMGPAAQRTQAEIQELRAHAQAMVAQGDAAAARSDDAAADALGRELETQVGEFQGLCRESIPHLRRSLELQPLFHRTYTSLGLSLVCLGDDAQAIEIYRRGMGIEDRYFPAKRDADLSRNMARMLVQYGRFAEAVPVARRAVELSPGDPAARADLERALSGLASSREPGK